MRARWRCKTGDAGGEVDESVMLCCVVLPPFCCCWCCCSKYVFSRARAKLMHLRLLWLLNMLHTMHREAGKFMCYLHECINLACKWSGCILTSHKGKKEGKSHTFGACFVCLHFFLLNFASIQVVQIQLCYMTPAPLNCRGNRLRRLFYKFLLDLSSLVRTANASCWCCGSRSSIEGKWS